MGFTNSLRKRFNIENEAFLNNEVLDEKINPNVTLSFSNGELALVNDNQMVKIGNEIFQFNADGYISVSFNYNTLLYDLLYNPSAVVDQPGVVIQNNTTADCKGWKATTDPHNYAPNNYRANRVAKIRSAPFYTKTEKMTIHYRKGSRRWKEARAYMSLDITHALSDKNCNRNFIGGSKPMNTYKNKKRRDIHLHDYGNDIIKAEKNIGLRGAHRYNNIVTYYSLSW